MLSEISIRDVVLIDSLDLDLRAGFSAMTGETGAGKSIILDALSMATGSRSDKGLLRAGATKAQCIGRFELPISHPVWAVLDNVDFEHDKSEDLVLRRTLGKDGRSRAYINDTPVSAKLLADVGAHLLEIHGQHDGRGLLDPATHLSLLDRFGGLEDDIQSCGRAYAQMADAQKTLDDLLQRQTKAEEDRAYYTHAIAELDRLAPQTGEDEALARERKILQLSEGALLELEQAEQALSDDSGFETKVSQALAGLGRLENKLGSEDVSTIKTHFNRAIGALERVLLEMEEARNAVATAAEHFVFEPGHLDHLEKRLFALRAAARKYDVGVEQLLDLRVDFGDRLNGYDRIDADIERAQKQAQDAKNTYNDVADTLSKARRKAAKQLDAKVAQEMKPLKLDAARFVSEIETTADGPSGRDKVRFLVSTNPGSPLGALNKVASGGELSRFALAIKVALAGAGDKVMVFDEVDQGVGGAVADAIGKRLVALSENGQVLIVTHSPQIAASAAHQYKIRKTSDHISTITHVEWLSDMGRREEIARMLAGEEITDAARKAAKQLMQAL